MPHVPDTVQEMKIILPDAKTKRIDAISEFLAKRYGYKASTMKLYIHKRVFGDYLDVAEILDRMDENDEIIKKRKEYAVSKNLPQSVDHKVEPPSAPKMELPEIEEDSYSKLDFEQDLKKVRRLASDYKDKDLSEHDLETLSREFFDIIDQADNYSVRPLSMHFLATLYGYAYGTMDSYYSMNILGKYDNPRDLIANLVSVDKIIAMRKRRRTISTAAREAAAPVDKKTQSSDQLVFEIQKRQRQVDKYNEIIEASTKKRDFYQKELDALKTAYDILNTKTFPS